MTQNATYLLSTQTIIRDASHGADMNMAIRVCDDETLYFVWWMTIMLPQFVEVKL